MGLGRGNILPPILIFDFLDELIKRGESIRLGEQIEREPESETRRVCWRVSRRELASVSELESL